MKYILNSCKGTHRTVNQDGHLILKNDNISLFLIFDGVSSYKDSNVFIKEYKKIIKEEFEQNTNFLFNLEDVLYRANLTISKMNIEGYSTVCLLLFSGLKKRFVQYMNIGDSRLYHYAETYLEKITDDHNIGDQKNILTKFLGSNQLELTDFQIKTAPISKHYLLCTDGFYVLMENKLKRYFNIVNFSYLNNVLKALIKEGKGLNRDDSTFIIVRV